MPVGMRHPHVPPLVVSSRAAGTSPNDDGTFPLPRISVVVPARDEAPNLPLVLPRIPRWVHEVILVDDHSSDGTAARAREIRPDVRVVANERPPGKGNALLTGFAAATGEVIVQLDADGSAVPEELPAFVGALLAGADLVK